MLRAVAIALLLVFHLAGSAGAQALSLPDTGVDAPALQTLMEEAAKDGSTVIVVKPGQTDAAKPDTGAMQAIRAERFLAARRNLIVLTGKLAGLPQRALATLKAASPDGSWWWLLRAVATAAVGIVGASLASVSAFRWASRHFAWSVPASPRSNSDQVLFLFSRVLRSVALIVIGLVAGFAVAVLFDSGHEPTRRVIFDLLVFYAIYRFLRHGVSWNLFAPDVPAHRLVNLPDEVAQRTHLRTQLTVLAVVLLVAPLRSLTVIGRDVIEAGYYGGLDIGDLQLLQLLLAAVVTVGLISWTLFNARALGTMFVPRAPNATAYGLRRRVALLVPVVLVLYAVVSFLLFAFRLLLDAPAPGVVLAAPFGVLVVAAMIYALAIFGVDIFYRARTARFERRAELARAERLAQAPMPPLPLEPGEEMVAGAVQPPDDIALYHPLFRPFIESALLAVVATVAIGELGRAWGVQVGAEGNWLAAGLDILLTTLLGWTAYRAVCAWVEHRMSLEGGPEEVDEEALGNEGGAGASRMATLLPIVRYVLIAIIVVAAIITILSRMGIDIGPAIAGAGVVGIAVGFGAQKLIQDVFSGAFFLLDDAFRRGEYVEIDQVKGVVEKISIRSFQLRHHLGALHTIPFGEIKQLTNYSRDWVMMKLPLRVTYDTDVDRVRKLVKKLGQELLTHEQIGHTFLQPLKSQGVYAMEDSAMIIRVKFMTRPGEQFVTRKVVYEAIQDLFAREGIRFAHKEVTVRLADGASSDRLSEDEKRAVASAARSVLDDEAALTKEGDNGDR